LHERPGSYLAFLGRISPEKCPDHAIEIAKRVGMPLRIAAKVDPADHAYFKDKIEHLLDHPLIEYVGEINDAEKNDFLGEAAALLCPYDWPEPFGLVLIEAMACGTPVLVSDRVNIWREIVEDGAGRAETPNAEAFAAAMVSLLRDESKLRAMGEAARASVARRYQWNAIAADLERLYAQVIEKHRSPAAVLPATARP
jgi:glycosyltransferase involved in cell wall biosynthesis